MPFKGEDQLPKSVAFWVRKVLGAECDLAPTLIEAMGKNEARRLLKRVKSTMKDTERRLKYVRGAIERARRVKEIEAWFHNNPDPTETAMGEIDRVEYAEYCDEACAKEAELDIVGGSRPGLYMMVDVIGYEAAVDLFQRCAKVYDIDTEDGLDRIHAILSRAVQPHIRYPERYVEKCLNNAE